MSTLTQIYYALFTIIYTIETGMSKPLYNKQAKAVIKTEKNDNIPTRKIKD